ncbi:MAG: GNAT family N-acetyltransferase [Armatimonadota bacterium]|nr:GNAT family N-acetyltransferase [Armatimonadota bacterium]
MADMLVKLYDQPDLQPHLDALAEEGIVVRRAQPWELGAVRRFIREHFSAGWTDEASLAFARQPISLFLAQDGKRMVGFAAYECTARNFFGPMGVDEEYRKRGIGAALTLACLHAMHEMGYGYAIIGAAGPEEFYTKVCGAEPIEGSKPGIYRWESIE